MSAVLDLLAQSPVLTVFLVVALGTALGAVPLGPLRFGAAGALFVGLAVAVWLACRLTTDAVRHTSGLTSPTTAWTLVLAVTVAQGIVGYSQFFSGLPVPLVLIHMLLAALFAAAVTNGILALRRR